MKLLNKKAVALEAVPYAIAKALRGGLQAFGYHTIMRPHGSPLNMRSAFLKGLLFGTLSSAAAGLWDIGASSVIGKYMKKAKANAVNKRRKK